jgi:hypothetical protein
LKQQRSIAQLFFENGPMMVLQTCIQYNYVPCGDLLADSSFVLYFSYFTTIISMIFVSIDIKLQSKALDESFIIYCLNSLQARQGWIPFLH